MEDYSCPRNKATCRKQSTPKWAEGRINAAEQVSKFFTDDRFLPERFPACFGDVPEYCFQAKTQRLPLCGYRSGVLCFYLLHPTWNIMLGHIARVYLAGNAHMDRQHLGRSSGEEGYAIYCHFESRNVRRSLRYTFIYPSFIRTTYIWCRR